MPAADTELIGGPEHRAVVLAEPDPRWAERFAEVASAVRAALGAAALRVEHIGSTAVPGLVAKPIVDVLLVVEHPEREDDYVPALERAGFVLRVREPSLDQHRMLRTPTLDVHVHVFPPASREVGRHLALRDLLRADAAARELYADTKRRLARQDWPTINDYADAKTDVIQALLARAAAVAAGRLPVDTPG